MTPSSILNTAIHSANARVRRRAGWAILIGAGLAGVAVANQSLAAKAERDNPPKGKFVEVDGVRLHYLDRGHGDPIVLIHGNGTMIEDFTSSGLVDMAAVRHRVVAFDRPGFGHSERPRTTIWTQNAQADLIARAMAKIGMERATVLGHSWGCSVALALAERHPQAVKALVLVSGYYFPSVRSDVLTATAPAIPVLGDFIRYTVSPVFSRAMWPIFLGKVFGPEIVPDKFEGFPEGDGLSTVADPGQRCRHGPDDPRCCRGLPAVQHHRRTDRDHRRYKRRDRGSRGSIGPAARRAAEQLSPSHPRRGTHDPTDGHRGRDGGYRRSVSYGLTERHWHPGKREFLPGHCG